MAGTSTFEENNGYNVPAQVADLSMTKTVDITNPTVGDIIEFTITLTNDGPDAATGVVVVDLLPIGFAYINDIPSVGVYNFTSGMWTLIDPVPSGSSETLTIQASVNAPTGTPGEYINVTQVTMSDQTDPDSEPNNDDGDQSEDDEAAVEVIPVIPTSDLSLTKTASDNTPTVGDVITFTLQIDNDGPDTATGVAVEDMLPTGFGNVSNITPPGSFLAGVISWTDLTVTTSGLTLTYDVTVLPPTGASGEYVNVAQITASDTFDPDSTPGNDDPTEDDQDSNEVDPVIITPPNDVDIELTKSVDVTGDPFVGDTIVFAITATNTSSNPATGVVVEEILPGGYNYVSSVASIGTYDEIAGLWTIGGLNANETATLTITVTVADVDDYVNTVTIIGLDQTDTNSGNDTASAGITPNCMVVYNEFSPNGDGVNEVFQIDCLEQYPGNVVRIYNRWGNIVFEKANYDNSFFGRSNGRANYAEEELLPVGTYYYIIDLGNGQEPRAGWLYINR